MTEGTEGMKKYRRGILYDISVDDLHPDPEQPRKYFDSLALDELKASITKLGVLEPLLVRRRPEGGFFLVSGERRFQAAQQAGMTTLPVLLTDGDPMEVSLVENLLRENLTAIEEAEAVERLRSEHCYSLADLSGILGKAESTLSEILSLNKLPDTVKSECRNDPKASRSILKEIAKQKTMPKMMSLYEKYKQKGLTRGEVNPVPRTSKGSGSSFNLQFVEVCIRKLYDLETGKLDGAQAGQLREALDRLRAAAQETQERLNSQGSGS